MRDDKAGGEGSSAPWLSCRYCSRTLGNLGALGMHMKACKQRPAEEDDRGEALFKDYEQRRWAKPRRRLAAPRVGASLGASQESYKKATSRRPW